MNYPSMIRHTLAFAVVVALIVLAGCASPKTASIKDGEITGLPSHEVTTLVKQDNRTKRANDVMKNSKPIVKFTAQPGQTITFSGVESFEVNVPIDPALLMADQPDVTSENVQMFDRATRFGERVAVPLGLGAMAASDRKDSRAAGLEEARIRAAEREAQNAAQADTVNRILDRPIPVLTLPVGGSAGVLRLD